MTIRCEQLDELLLDGERLALATAERHAQTCAACRQTLDDWKEMSATARSLHTTWESDLLLPRIQRAIRQEAQPARSRWMSIAAAAVLTIGIGSSSWYAVRFGSRDALF